MKKIFITGICGFLGSNLAYYYQSLGYKVYGIDNLSRKGSKKNVNLLRNIGVKVFIKDLTKFDEIKKLKNTKNFKLFIHCAALTSVLDGTHKNSSTNFIFKNNFLSTLNSLELCKIISCPYIYISSSRVYSIVQLDKLKFKIINNAFKLKKNSFSGVSTKGVDENFSTEQPLSFYGSSKLMCESLVKEFCIYNNIPFVINRCGLLAGSGQHYKNDQGIISFWINSWKLNKKLKYIGYGGHGYQTRDCLHPFDCANLITKQSDLIKEKKIKDCIFNVSGGISSSFSLKELSTWCKNNILIKKIGYDRKTRPFDLKWLVLDNSKAKKIFKWKINISKQKIFEDIKINDN